MNQYIVNPQARVGSAHPGLFEPYEYDLAQNFFNSRTGFKSTPLIHLRNLASKLGIGDIVVKDESSRLGLDSFKILGVSYAVWSLRKEGLLSKRSVLVCATEGNHGRAVARAARESGLDAKIYVAADMSAGRRDAISREGAELLIVDGNYDDAVRIAADDARRKGWTIISDTAWSEYVDVPRRIMAGYTRLVAEAEDQWSPDPPIDVVLVQAGVGGLACAVLSSLCNRFGTERPFTIVCEPVAAASFLKSAQSGKPVHLQPFDTIMAGLRCGEISVLAWPTIAAAADAFVSIDDEQCAAAMRTLAHPTGNDANIVAGAAGACGLAALLAVLQEDELRKVREAAGLGAQSRVLVINTEGATDPELYARITGNDPATKGTSKTKG